MRAEGRTPGWPRIAGTAATAAAGALGTVLAGCAVGPNFARPDTPRETQFVQSGDPRETVQADGVSQHFSPGERLAGDWWRLFGSPELQSIIAAALAENPGLAAAQASLRASEANLASGYGIFFPQVEGDGRASRERFSAIQFGENLPNSLFNLFTLSASASYALDIFGGERRQLEALGAAADEQRATERATYLTLVANVVNTVVAAAAYRAEVDATNELIALQREQVGLAQVQYRAGTQPYSSVLALQSELAATQASVPPLEQKLAEAEDLLATLAGRAPGEWSPPRIALASLHLPSDLPISLPSDLVRQRPDILLAEATAHVASANVGVATAAMLPSLQLSGSYSASGTSTPQLFAKRGQAWSAGADLSAPLFEGGTLWYRRKAAVETYRQSVALYRQAVLGAFEQVADTLRALDHDAAALQAEQNAVDSAREALRLVQVNYTAGLATYLDVISADTQYHQALINQLQAVAVRYQDTVALYVALGGGWWNSSEPAARAR